MSLTYSFMNINLTWLMSGSGTHVPVDDYKDGWSHLDFSGWNWDGWILKLDEWENKEKLLEVFWAKVFSDHFKLKLCNHSNHSTFTVWQADIQSKWTKTIVLIAKLSKVQWFSQLRFIISPKRMAFAVVKLMGNFDGRTLLVIFGTETLCITVILWRFF